MRAHIANEIAIKQAKRELTTEIKRLEELMKKRVTEIGIHNAFADSCLIAIAEKIQIKKGALYHLRGK